MRRACFGAVIGENRLMRSYDALGWSAWGWTPVINDEIAKQDGIKQDFGGIQEVAEEIQIDIAGIKEDEREIWDIVVGEEITSGVREVISTFGENIIALCDLAAGGQAIFHSPNNGDKWSMVLAANEIYDITSVGYNWTLASTSDGWYSSLKAGSSWDLVCPAGEGVPVGKSVVWVLPDHLFAHDGSKIWLSEDKAVSWRAVCDLIAISGYLPTKFNSIDGYQGRVIATCGYALVETLNLGTNWSTLNLSSVIRDWRFVSVSKPIWRQIAFWDTLNATDPSKSRWMISALLGDVHIIRTYINRGTGIFSPAVDMALSERHRLNVTSSKRMGSPIIDHSLMISGDRRISGELRHAVTVSTDGIKFSDVLGGSRSTVLSPCNESLDKAHAAISALERLT